ncbi:MAG: SDR family NAD(P)-dependent oxidoreductase [Actinomycetota bacterium]
MEGRTAVVTGSGSGIGFALARRFVTEGMRVVLADVDEAALTAAVAALADDGGDVLGVPVDVSRIESVEALAAAAEEAYGPVHLLCNNAGVHVAGSDLELGLDDWTWCIDVDLWSVVYGHRAFVPRMIEHGEGAHVVNTASMAGLVAGSGLTAYHVAKYGVVAASESLEATMRERELPVRVSVLCPGFVRTAIADSARVRTEPGTASATDEAQAVDAMLRQGVEEGIDAGLVASHVVDAVRRDRFWIFTHPDHRDALEARFAGVLEGFDAAAEVTP